MAKAKLSEKHTISAEGTLDINEDKTINLEIEDIGVKSLADILEKFNGCNIKITAGYSFEGTED